MAASGGGGLGAGARKKRRGAPGPDDAVTSVRPWATADGPPIAGMAAGTRPGAGERRSARRAAREVCGAGVCA